LAELVDGSLVDKAMGFPEGGFAVTLLVALATFVRENKLGLVATNDDYMRLRRGLVRIPDISFTSKARLKAGWTKKQIADFAPDLAVEYLSPGNTKAEMARKRREYFAAGTKLVWEVHIRRRYVDVYTSPKEKTRLTERNTLTGGNVLPGFSYPVRDLFINPLA
jgi:Uma2 family endonuclease